MKHDIAFDPIKITSINLEQNKKLSDLEMFFLVVQELIQGKIKNGRKGKKLSLENKITYKTMQGILYAIHSDMATKGCFSFGICATCSNFDNGAYVPGYTGKCKGKVVNCFHSCDEHSIDGGGFGL